MSKKKSWRYDKIDYAARRHEVKLLSFSEGDKKSQQERFKKVKRKIGGNNPNSSLLGLEEWPEDGNI